MLTRKHFDTIAMLLAANHATPKLVWDIGTMCKQSNPAFDRLRFNRAAGITEEHEERFPHMQIYNIIIEVELDNAQVETLEALDEAIVSHVAELRALSSMVARRPVEAFITRQRPYADALELELPVHTDAK